MPHDYWIVDAFTDRPFSGNPAAVVPLAHAAEPAWMQAVAAEMNLSETAFSWPEGDGFRIRWFTPKAEVKLCGHATLATAAVMWRSGRVADGAPIRFVSAGGPLGAQRDGALIALDFPAKRCTPCEPPAGLEEVLGCWPLWCGRAGDDLLAELPDAATVRELTPDLAILAQLPIRALMITARADDAAYDVVSRFFAPSVGVPEDPVTGSAHCALGPHWAARLGRDRLRCRQASVRGGDLLVSVLGERVRLAGAAVIVAEGHLLTDHP